MDFGVRKWMRERGSSAAEGFGSARKRRTSCEGDEMMIFLSDLRVGMGVDGAHIDVLYYYYSLNLPPALMID